MLRPLLVCAVLMGGLEVSIAQEPDPFAAALKLADGCSAFEFDYRRAEQFAQAMNMPPEAIPTEMNQLMSAVISPEAPNLALPARPTLPEEACREGYAMYGPGGTSISGLLKPRAFGSGIAD